MNDSNLPLFGEIGSLDCGSFPFLPCCESPETRKVFLVDIMVCLVLVRIRCLNKSCNVVVEDNAFLETSNKAA